MRRLLVSVFLVMASIGWTGQLRAQSAGAENDSGENQGRPKAPCSYAVLDLGEDYQPGIISNSGILLANKAGVTSNDDKCYRWKDGQFTELTVSGGGGVSAYDVDDAGNTVGYAVPKPDESVVNTAIYWPAASTLGTKLSENLQAVAPYTETKPAYSVGESIDNGVIYGTSWIEFWTSTSLRNDASVMKWSTASADPKLLHPTDTWNILQDKVRGGHVMIYRQSHGSSPDTWTLDGATLGYQGISVNKDGVTLGKDKASGEYFLNGAAGRKALRGGTPKALNARKVKVVDESGAEIEKMAIQAVGDSGGQAVLWQEKEPEIGEYIKYAFIDIVPSGWSVESVSSINDQGVIAARVKKDGGVSHIGLLLPVDIKVNQTEASSYGSSAKYKDAPKAYPASNLFCVWPNEKVTIKVKLPPPFDQEQNLPAGLIKWNVPGHTIADNTLEPELSWPLTLGSANTKEIKITVGGSEFKVHVKVQGVGFLTSVEASALFPNAAAALLTYRDESITFGNTHPISAQKDAMRHSYWCSLAVSTFGVTAGDVVSVSTAHEFDNRDNGQQAFNSTMDLKNNDVGMSVNHQVNGFPDKPAIQTELRQKYAAGEMFVWEIPKGKADAGQEQSEGIIVKSNRTRVFP